MKTNKCNFAIAKETVINSFVHLGIPKNSPYTESLNKGLGIMRLLTYIGPSVILLIIIAESYAYRKRD